MACGSNRNGGRKQEPTEATQGRLDATPERRRNLQPSGRGGCQKTRRLTEMWAAGFPASRIAAELGTTKNAILGKAHRLKLPGRSMPIQARAPSTSKATTTTWADQGRVDVLKAMWAQGASVRMIATRLGVSRHAVFNKAKALGLPRRGTFKLDAREPMASEPSPSSHADTERRDDQDDCQSAAGSEDSPSSSAPLTPPTPPAVASSRSAAGCRWPLWNDQEQPTHVYCGASVSRKWPGVYCDAHRARAFTRVAAMARGSSSAEERAAFAAHRDYDEGDADDGAEAGTARGGDAPVLVGGGRR